MSPIIEEMMSVMNNDDLNLFPGLPSQLTCTLQLFLTDFEFEKSRCLSFKSYIHWTYFSHVLGYFLFFEIPLNYVAETFFARSQLFKRAKLEDPPRCSSLFFEFLDSRISRFCLILKILVHLAWYGSAFLIFAKFLKLHRKDLISWGNQLIGVFWL